MTIGDFWMAVQPTTNECVEPVSTLAGAAEAPRAVRNLPFGHGIRRGEAEMRQNPDVHEVPPAASEASR